MGCDVTPLLVGASLGCDVTPLLVGELLAWQWRVCASRAGQ